MDATIAADCELEFAEERSVKTVPVDPIDVETVFSGDGESVVTRPTDYGPPSSDGCERTEKEKIMSDKFNSEVDLPSRPDDCHTKLDQELKGVWTGKSSTEMEDLVVGDNTNSTNGQPSDGVITTRLNFAPFYGPSGPIRAYHEAIDHVNINFKPRAVELNTSHRRESQVTSSSEDDQTIEWEFIKIVLQLDVLPDEPMLVALFREYDVLLEILQQWHSILIQQESSEKLSKYWSSEGCDEIQKLVFQMDKMIQDIALTTRGVMKGSSDVNIEWKALAEYPDLFSRIQPSVGDPLMLEHRKKVYIISNKSEKSSRKKLLKQFGDSLAKLELLIEKRVGNHWAITSAVDCSRVMVGWPLDVQCSSSMDARSRSGLPGNEEITLGFHEREEVPRTDLEPNGKSRGITKLSLCFREPSGKIIRYMGSGWLVESDTIATVGHCVFDRLCGRLVGVEVFTGYETQSRQVRRGTRAVVHWGWYKSFSSRHDLAFIRLDHPFENTHKIPYLDTPVRATNMPISVYGYPGDLSRGKRMYYSEGEVSYDLSLTEWVLEHDLDTAGGNSGGPVCDQEGRVIGIHRGSAWAKGWHRHGKEINQAVILDQCTNNIGSFLRVLRHIDTGHSAADLQVISRAMNAAGDFLQYTVHE